METSKKNKNNMSRPAYKGESKRASIQKKENCNESTSENELLLDNRNVIVKNKMFDNNRIKEIGLKLREIYREVEKIHNEEVSNELNTTFKEAVENKPEQSTNLFMPPMHLRPKCEVKSLGSSNKINDNIVCVEIESGLVLPPMAYWLHVESNVKADDNLRLSHVPYLNENQDDDDLCEDLHQLFEEGIHGYSENWKYVNDSLLFLVLQKALDIYPDEQEHVYFAFYQLFPNKLSYRKLPKIFEQLREKWDTNYQKDSQILCPRDNENLRCLQCSSYACTFHGFSPFLHNNYKNGNWIIVKLPLPPNTVKSKNVCSENCWRSIERCGVLDEFKISSENDDSEANEIELRFDKCQEIRKLDSTFLNVIILLSLKDVNEESFCIFAKQASEFFLNKSLSCSEIYKKLLRESERPSKFRLYADREKLKVDVSQMNKNFRNSTWARGVGKIKNQYRLDPCNHQGSCDSDNIHCGCNKNGVCTKFCSCDNSCKIKFPGCRCAPGMCRTKQCQCFYAKWECDPITCKTCQCDDVISKEKMCKNAVFSKGFQKKLKVFPSQIAGWGAYLMEPAEKGDFISEYTGELISTSEVERRGHIYDKFKTSYLFALNENECIDAHKMGNLIRFANHSDKNDNCYTKIIIVNGQARIGIFAKTDLKEGVELLFDYSYNKKHKEEFVANDRLNSKESKLYLNYHETSTPRDKKKNKK